MLKNIKLSAFATATELGLVRRTANKYLVKTSIPVRAYGYIEPEN